uniref:Uncharacterized protein n=1 Tax=Eutreptiella gymnastica TaxID=73025 RepID=A0A7S4GC44_9EUGL
MRWQFGNQPQYPHPPTLAPQPAPFCGGRSLDMAVVSIVASRGEKSAVDQRVVIAQHDHCIGHTNSQTDIYNRHVGGHCCTGHPKWVHGAGAHSETPMYPLLESEIAKWRCQIRRQMANWAKSVADRE